MPFLLNKKILFIQALLIVGHLFAIEKDSSTEQSCRVENLKSEKKVFDDKFELSGSLMLKVFDNIFQVFAYKEHKKADYQEIKTSLPSLLIRKKSTSKNALEDKKITIDAYADESSKKRKYITYRLELTINKTVVGFTESKGKIDTKEIYLSDLEIDPAYQSLGLGTILFKLSKKLFHDLDYKKMTWCPLSKNKKQDDLIRFYQNLGAKVCKDDDSLMECTTAD